MNQYIITEDLLLPIEELYYPVSLEERQCLSNYARSHPYNPQAERFTKDELSDLFIIVDADIERHGKDTKTMKLLHKIEELRKDGE